MLKVKTVSETMDPGELYDRLYFDEFIIGACLFVCVFGALVLAAALSVQSIIEAAQVPTFRLLSTGNRPDLALAKGHKWHLFLSHIWGTGQDQCATIKRQLSLLLTGVSVFLDVDDLEVTPTLTLSPSPSPSPSLTLTLTLPLSLTRTSAPWRSTSSRPPSS